MVIGPTPHGAVDWRIPSEDQKNALDDESGFLPGASGPASQTNPYVRNDDPRLSGYIAGAVVTLIAIADPQVF